MSPIKVVLMLVFILIPSTVRARGTSSLYSSPINMDKMCNKTIMLHGDTLPGTFFSLSSNHYQQNLDCILTIKAPTTSQRILIVIEKMDVACGGDKLLIYEGKQGTLLNKNESLQCGINKYFVQTTNSNIATIEFISNNDGKVASGFILNVAINFPVATCSRSDNLYRCRNRNCVSNLFNCDERNWCGDNTQLFVCR